MLIKKIRIFNNYRRFHDLTIDLGENPKRIIALVGPNGCGKSSVFDAVIYHCRAHGVILGKSNNSRDRKYHFMPGFETNDYHSINIEFSDGKKYNDIWHELHSKGLGNTIFLFRSSYRYNNTVDIKETRAVDPIEKNNIGASTSSDVDERMEDNYRRLHAKYRDYSEKEDAKPSDAKKHIIGELNTAISNCLAIKISGMGNVEAGNGSLFFQKPDSPNEFSFNVLSSGEKEVVDILTDLYLRKDTFCNAIYLIDEPELHISTSIQRKLIIEIDRMIPDGCQIWIATHSIGMLRALQEELKDKSDIVRFDENNEWAKGSFTLYPMQKSRKNWQAIFATALDDITALLAPKRIIYCEGRDKPSNNGGEKGFDAQVYNMIFENEFPDTLFVSSGGNTELDIRSEIAIAIIGKALPQTEILVLKDRDMASGKPVTEDDRQEYLRLNPDNHRVLRRFELENYLFDETVLQKYCMAKGKTFAKAKYDALNLDITNGDIKAKCNDIKNACTIVGSISAEKFKIELAAFLSSDLAIYKELKEEIFERK